MYSRVKRAAGDEHKAELNDIRENFIRLASDVRDNRTDALAEGQRNYLDSVIQTLELAPKIEKLVGSPAPELTILWSSDPSVTSLASLRGKVVILDFWATWCGPCVATFPEIREITAHYEGYPVVVLGVTSPQGSVIMEDGAVAAETPEAEFDLMADYMEWKDVTWTVVFTEEDVFNPEYGVRGIPHTAIIDAEGVVRHRGIHPSQGLAEISKLIDPLLTEANLTAPPPIESEAQAHE